MVEHKGCVSYSVLINGLEVNAVYSRESIEGIFLPLLRRLTKMQKEKGRRLHDPVDDVITVDGDIVLLEGNYLLLDEPGWRELRKYADYTVLIRADEELLRRRLTDRKAEGMASCEEAEKFVEFSDIRNVRTCLEHSGSADLELEMTGDGEYRIVAG